MRWLVLVAALMLVPVLSGCTASGCGNSSQGQSCEGPGIVSYNGASDGTQTSDGLECGTTGTISWTSNIGSGSVTIKVLDGAGVTKFSEKLSGPGQSADEEAVTGIAGDWVVQAVRSGTLMSGGFSGQYAVDLRC